MKLARKVASYFAASALVLGSIAADEPAKIHECMDAKGKVVYQDEPCLVVAPIAVEPPIAPPPLAPPPGQRAVDARWATPEKTLRTFVGAVKAGDRALVLSCLTS